MLRLLQATKLDGCQALSRQAQVGQAMRLTDAGWVGNWHPSAQDVHA